MKLYLVFNLFEPFRIKISDSFSKLGKLSAKAVKLTLKDFRFP